MDIIVANKVQISASLFKINILLIKDKNTLFFFPYEKRRILFKKKRLE